LGRKVGAKGRAEGKADGKGESYESEGAASGGGGRDVGETGDAEMGEQREGRDEKVGFVADVEGCESRKKEEGDKRDLYVPFAEPSDKTSQKKGDLRDRRGGRLRHPISIRHLIWVDRRASE
jgi:hypothetical protein